MADDDFELGGKALSSNPVRWLTHLDLFRRISQPCANPTCERRQALWSFWQRGSDGIELQGRWHCSPECFEEAARREFHRLRAVPEPNLRQGHRMPIGLLLLSRGVITETQLKQALALQREKGTGRLGTFLREMEAATEYDIVAGLASQWGCPVFTLSSPEESLPYASMLPMVLLESVRMLPVNHVRIQHMLYLAFVEGIDRNALYSVEQMLRLRTIPCVVAESAYRGAMEELRRTASVPTTVFESPLESREMASTTRSYAWQLGANEVWMVRSGRFIWVRLQNAQGPKDVLFQLLPGAR